MYPSYDHIFTDSGKVYTFTDDKRVFHKSIEAAAAATGLKEVVALVDLDD